MIYLTQRLDRAYRATASVTLSIDVRAESRARVVLSDGRGAGLVLLRGLLLYDDDLLSIKDDSEAIGAVVASESVFVMRCADPFLLTKACYYFGNHHVPLQILLNELCYHHDHAPDDMLRQFNFEVTFARLPFGPEAGAYMNKPHGHHHGYAH